MAPPQWPLEVPDSWETAGPKTPQKTSPTFEAMIENLSSQARSTLPGTLADAQAQAASLELAEQALAKLEETLKDTPPKAALPNAGKGKGQGDSDYQKQLKLVEELKGGKVTGAQSVSSDMLLSAFNHKARELAGHRPSWFEQCQVDTYDIYDVEINR